MYAQEELLVLETDVHEDGYRLNDEEKTDEDEDEEEKTKEDEDDDEEEEAEPVEEKQDASY